MRDQTRKKHLLTISLEDYFQVGAFRQLISHDRWHRFESAVEQNTLRTLDLLDQHSQRATFFVVGWTASQHPALLREVVRRGHEVASSGYFHRGFRQMSQPEFAEDLKRSRDAIENASGRQVLGYRVADGSMEPKDLWALDVLADQGYAYDSSILPRFGNFRSDPKRLRAHQQTHNGNTIWEFPLPAMELAGLRFPIAGGNYFRQFPHTFMKHLVDRWDRTETSPFVLYFHTWELDPEQARISAPFLSSIRHYRNLEKMNWIVSDYFRKFQFESVADRLGLKPEVREVAAAAVARETISVQSRSEELAEPITLVIPCYNEKPVIPYLANTLKSLEEKLAGHYRVEYVFVDDASPDGTGDVLEKTFPDRERYRILRHEKNEGVARAILNGLAAARTEIVASIDCDCSYDPSELRNMLPLLDKGVDLVTASPYHPRGAVRNVPNWRLGLSKGASWLYKKVLGTDLHTYTSCFRVYRRSAFIGIPIQNGGFLGVAETLGKLVLKGGRVEEYPATLEVRLFGQSKMKVARTIGGHLGLLWRLAKIRRAGPKAVANPIGYVAVLTALADYLGNFGGRGQ